MQEPQREDRFGRGIQKDEKLDRFLVPTKPELRSAGDRKGQTASSSAISILRPCVLGGAGKIP